MIPVKKIIITRGEGPTALCGKPHEFATFKLANTWLRWQSSTFPAKGGYDKHDFMIIFEDGEEYSGRLDCKHHSCENNDLDIREHILSFVRWNAGRETRPWCGMEKYLQWMSQESEETKKHYADFMDKYLVDQVVPLPVEGKLVAMAKLAEKSSVEDPQPCPK